ncbi:MAG: sulfotransferase family 2 domain-containing protein [Microcoleaceae cyanobacterium]
MENYYKRNNDVLIVFLHIPKAGGTTLNGIINLQYSRNRIIRANGINNAKSLLASLSAEEVERIQMLRGHFAFGIHEFINRSCSYFTLLRDPVKRVISQYYYIRNSPSLPNHGLLNSISLEEYISREKDKLCNQQTRMLFGLSKAKCNSNSDMLDAVKQNLETHFAVVGLTEMFDETLVLLRKKFGWKIPFYIRQNVRDKNRKSTSASESTLKLIEKYGELDIELYHYVRARFKDTIEQQEDSFAKDLAKIKMFNSAYQPVGRSYSFARHVLLHNLLKRY